LRAIVDALAQAAIVTDLDGVIRLWNGAAERLYGWREHEVLGRPIVELLLPAEAHPIGAKVLGDVAASLPHEQSWLLLTKAGELVETHVETSLVRDSTGDVIAMVGLSHDVTTSRALEVAASTASEQLRQALVSERRRALLAEATSEVAVSLRLDESLRRLARLVVPELADWTIIDLADERGRPVQVAMVHRDRDENDSVIQRFSELQPQAQTDSAPIMQVLAGSGPSLHRDARIPDAVEFVSNMELLELCAQLGICSTMYVPLSARGRVLGCLTLVSGSSGRLYDESDLEYAVDLANRAALVIDNSSLYEREHRIAEVLQNSLLPTLADVDRLQIASRYVPSDQATTVGGDFFDLIELPCGGIGLAVGDVGGHDLNAAAAMGQLRGLFRAYAWESCDHGETNPAGVLDRLDWYLQALRLAPLATVLYVHATLDEATGDWRLAVATAGHLPPLVRFPDGTVDEISVQGIVLGADASIHHTNVFTTIAPGSTLVMFTDGLVERRDQAWDVGFDRVAKLLSECSPAATADEIADHLVGMLEGERPDDVAVLVVNLGTQ